MERPLGVAGLGVQIAAVAWSLVALGPPTRAATTPAGPGPDPSGLIVAGPLEAEPVRPGYFAGDLRDLPTVKFVEQQQEANPRHIAPGYGPLPDTSGPLADPLWQRELFPGPTPTAGSLSAPILSFDGVATGALPHDANGDAGPAHYVQGVNSSIAVFDKTGLLIAGPTVLNSIWTGLGGPCAAGNGDPIILYDQLADRWLISQLAVPSHECIAISQTPNPTGPYYLYAFDVGAFPDYPKLAVWPDGYYMTANFGGNALVAAFDRASMLAGFPAAQVTFTIAGLAGLGFNIIMPGDLDGATPPPAGTPNYFYREVDGAVFGGADRIELFRFSVDWAGPDSFVLESNLATAPFDMALCGFLSFSCVPQSGSAVRLDPLNEIAMWRGVYRRFATHESYLGSFAVDVNGADLAGVRWFELRRSGGGAWSLFQEGTYAPQDGGADEHRWNSSIAMDGVGNIALGYSTSGTGMNPGIRYTGRRAADPAGTLPQGEDVLFNGSAPTASLRWGDYSALVVDPADDCTFWYTADYVAAGGVRRSRIGTFRFDNCLPVCGDGILQPGEACDPPGSAICDCCTALAGTTCSDPACTAAVCGYDPFCCSVNWDGFCGNEAAIDPACGCCGILCGSGCNICGDGAVQAPETCDPPGSPAPSCDCCTALGGAGCSSAGCTAAVCGYDAFCCSVNWDSSCANEAAIDPACGCCDVVCGPTCSSCGDGVVQPPEACDPPGSTAPVCNCCTAHGGLGCSDAACTAAVCSYDPYCCSVSWDNVCAGEAAIDLACGCCQVTCSDGCSLCGDGAVQAPETCDPPGPVGNCCVVHGGTGCSDLGCMVAVCGYDPFCCSVSWDGICAGEALTDLGCANGCNGCLAGCTYCGDGTVDPGEDCDPPATAGGSDCCVAHAFTGCSDPVCAAAVCGYDPYCCIAQWDGLCVNDALADPLCVGCAAPGLCNPVCCRDSDADAQCDAVDPCPLGDGFFDQTVRATTKIQFGWNFPAHVDWVKGDLNSVGAYGVIDFLSAFTATQVPAPELPAPGTGLYWIVRDDCNPTTWSTLGPAECYGPPSCGPGGRDGNLPPP